MTVKPVRITVSYIAEAEAGFLAQFGDRCREFGRLEVAI